MGLKAGGMRGSLRALSTGASVIPDSAILQWDAQALSASDGATVTTLPDELAGEVGDYSLTEGAGMTYQASGINGNPSLVGDGVDNVLHETTIPASITQPFTVILVQQTSTLDTSQVLFNGRTSSDGGVQYYPADDTTADTLVFAGGSINGVESTNSRVVSTVFNGASSILRENQTEYTGDAGTDNIDSDLALGASVANGSPVGSYYDGLWGESIIYNADLTASGELTSEEQRLADKWGITL